MKLSIRQKIFGIGLFLTLIPLLIIGLIFHFSTQQYLAETIRDNRETLTNNTSIAIRDKILNYKDSLETLAHNLTYLKSVEKKKEFIQKFQEEHSQNIKLLSFTDRSGQEIARTDRAVLKDKRKEPSFYKIKEGQKYYIEWLKWNPVIEIGSIIFSVPILKDGDFQGALTAEIFLFDIWQQTISGYASPIDNIYFFTENNKPMAEIVTTFKEFKLEKVKKIAKEFPVREKVSSKIIDTKIGSMLVTGKSIPTLQNGKLIVFSPLREVYKPILTLRNKIIVTGGIALVFLIIVTIFFSRLIVKPVKKLRRGADIIGKGNLEHKIEIKTGDEIEQLANDFNVMREELKNSRGKLEKNKEVLERTVKQRTKKLEKTKDKLAKTLEETQEAKKRAENEKNKTSAIISNLVDPIIIINPNNKISLFNPKAKEIFGFSKSDIGKKVDKSDYHSMENFKKVIDKDYQVIKGKDTEPKNLQEEELNIEYEGNTLTYKIITTKVHDNKKGSLGTMKIFSDLTRAKRINRLKTEFVSIAAHQLRTPLSAIKWVLKMVLEEDAGPLNEEQEDALKKGFESNERMIKLVNDMLNVSRIEEGRLEFNFAKINFKEVYETVTNNLKNKVKEKGIKFNIKKPTKMPSVYVDKERIRMVIQNLLDNAIKYTPNNGTVTLEIKKLKDKLKIRIKDNGVGIPQKDQQRLFTKFFRAENVKKMQTDGNGLGLFIANNIVKKHNSKIYFKSTEGRGTEFYFYLPLNKNKEN